MELPVLSDRSIVERLKSVAVFGEKGMSRSPRTFADGPQHDLRFHARRTAVSGIVIGCHIAFLLLVLNAEWKRQNPAPVAHLTAIDLSAPREPSKPARPTNSKQVQRIQVTALLPMPPLQSAASGSGDSTGCATAALVAQAISNGSARRTASRSAD
jgi:hypothetical protein